MQRHSRQIGPRCYACGRPMPAAESVAVDLAPAGQAFAEMVLMHQRCSPVSVADSPAAVGRQSFAARCATA